MRNVSTHLHICSLSRLLFSLSRSCLKINTYQICDEVPWEVDHYFLQKRGNLKKKVNGLVEKQFPKFLFLQKKKILPPLIWYWNAIFFKSVNSVKYEKKSKLVKILWQLMIKVFKDCIIQGWESSVESKNSIDLEPFVQNMTIHNSSQSRLSVVLIIH